MATRDVAPVGAPCWIDLHTSDPERARAFYSRAFGWAAEEPNPEFGDYFNFTKDGTPIAGGMAAQLGGASDVWVVYLAVDDAVKTLEVAQANGAQVIVPAMPVGELGVMGLLLDPAGAPIGIWQPKAFNGFGFVSEPGAPSWFQLDTRGYDTALAFYRAVFGWETEAVGDTPDFRYSVASVDGEQAAGVWDASGDPDAAVGWTVYLGVEDTDATLATVADTGGRGLGPAEDTPYGRLADAVDPMGARFKLQAPAA